ncbi:MAG: diguanylate cyclase [Oscillospiraceae bacterium]
MKKHSSLLMKIIVGLTILFGVLLILHANGISFNRIVVDDIENISKLSSSIIYSEINKSLTEPIFVGKTMANDLFLKNWLYAEGNKGGSLAQNNMLQQYLSTYSSCYGYDTVFLISEKSCEYYYQNGINKSISPQDKHDVWYYDFIESGKNYDLDVDIDETNNNQLTVFVNCRITGSEGELMGVAGVGIKMTHLQKLLRDYEDDYDLSAVLIDKNGLVQVGSNTSNIEVQNVFNDPELSKLKAQIIGEKHKFQSFWYPENGSQHCIITQYIENLDWYIVVAKDTVSTQHIFRAQMNRDLLIIGVIITLVLLLISLTFSKYNQLLLKSASLDDVTNLPNNKMFLEIFNHNARRTACHNGVVFMFDIDNFKDINDQFGHLTGNTVLYRVSEAAKSTIGNLGLVSRWGGDEFAGVIYGQKDDTDLILSMMMKNISEIKKLECTTVTVSLGATQIENGGSLEAMLHEADIAMYRAKKNGKNQIAFYM